MLHSLTSRLGAPKESRLLLSFGAGPKVKKEPIFVKKKQPGRKLNWDLAQKRMHNNSTPRKKSKSQAHLR